MLKCILTIPIGETVLQEQRDYPEVLSGVPARLGLKAAALAWPEGAPAF
jgi:hypothetical protein